MSRILKVRNVNDYGSYLGCREQHPLVCVVDYAEVSPIRHSLNNYSVYGLFLREDADVELEYGCGKYDYNKGTLLCVAPGQIGGKEDNGERMYITGWALLFHPDLLHGFPLERHIRGYSFFDYRVNEALHMTDEEHDIMVSLIRQATISAGSSSSLPRTGLLPVKPCRRYLTGSASNTPSISAVCSKNQRVSLRRNTANASIPAEQSAKINAPARASLSHRLRPMQPSALSARHCLSFPSG